MINEDIIEYHVPIMAGEVINYLITSPDGIYVDGTLGGGGHTRAILNKLNTKGKLISIDRDLDAIVHANDLKKNYNNFTCVHANFHDIDQVLKNLNINKIDGCLLDLGVSSHQLDSETRGFSVHNNSYIDMRMDTSSGLSASEYLNQVSKDDFEKALYNYADERWAKRIAEELIKFREAKKITMTNDLVEIVDKAIPASVRRKISGHPAIKTFQAVRIAINNEILPLNDTLLKIIDFLNPGTRLCVLTFHSIEDRIVKNCFRNCENPCTCDPKSPICVCGKKPLGKILTKKPIVPSNDELKINPRSHSAKLRVFEKQ